MNSTTDPALRSFVPVAPDSHFPIQNLPYGVFLEDAAAAKAEVHWYEAHGIGRKELKIKRFLDE